MTVRRAIVRFNYGVSASILVRSVFVDQASLDLQIAFSPCDGTLPKSRQKRKGGIVDVVGPLVLVVLVCCSTLTNAQTKAKVYHNDRQVNISRDTVEEMLTTRTEAVRDSLNKVSNHLGHNEESFERLTRKVGDSIYQGNLEKVKHLSDSILQSDLPVNPRAISSFRHVYSERIIKEIYDSLGANKLERLPLDQITEEDLLMLINDKFSSQPLLKEGDSLMSRLPSAGDLTKQRLIHSSLAELSPLTGRVSKSEYFGNLDSIRHVNIQAQGLELKERALSEFGKVAELREGLTFWDKSYFEGIIGVGNTEHLFVQLSPAMGYRFVKGLSFGIGPIINLFEDRQKKIAAVGIRPFFKQEFFRQRAYLQAEYIINSSVKSLETVGIDKRNALLGAGVLLPVSRSVAFNLCVMHWFNKDMTEYSNKSSWTFRIGISSTKGKE